MWQGRVFDEGFLVIWVTITEALANRSYAVTHLMLDATIDAACCLLLFFIWFRWHSLSNQILDF